MLTIWRYFRKPFQKSTGLRMQKINSQPKLNSDELSKPLVDRFGRNHTYLRISLTERCNLRCTYCMPAEGIQLTQSSNLLTVDEILHLAKLFVQQGIRKIRLTGGEPTVRKDLVEIISGLKAIEGLTGGVSITTNGVVLTRKLVPLQQAGLDALNISLDTFDPEKFEMITRRRGIEKVIAGIDLALQLGYDPVKVNCVVTRGFNDNEVPKFVEWTRNRNIDVRFIEYMPFDGNQWTDSKLVPYKEMLASIREHFPQIDKLTDGPNDTSKAYQIPGHRGRFGFITTMSEHFCGSCNRLRLTADGNLKVCLLGSAEISLRDALRNNCSEDDVVAMISAAVKRKKQQHAGTSMTWLSPQRMLTRQFSQLTHTGDDGKAKMVDVGEKQVTVRIARAAGCIHVGKEVASLIAANGMKKGDVLTVARLAGIMAAKRTSAMIPLAHDILLDHIDVTATLQDASVHIEATVRCCGKTGVEMEALTAVAIASLTIYDMCKAVTHDMHISDIRLIQKSGGQRGDYKR